MAPLEHGLEAYWVAPLELGQVGWYAASGGVPLEAAIGNNVGVCSGQRPPLEVAVTRDE